MTLIRLNNYGVWHLKHSFLEGETDNAVILLKITPSNIEYWDGRSSKIIVKSNTEATFTNKVNSKWKALYY